MLLYGNMSGEYQARETQGAAADSGLLLDLFKQSNLFLLPDFYQQTSKQPVEVPELDNGSVNPGDPLC